MGLLDRWALKRAAKRQGPLMELNEVIVDYDLCRFPLGLVPGRLDVVASNRAVYVFSLATGAVDRTSFDQLAEVETDPMSVFTLVASDGRRLPLKPVGRTREGFWRYVAGKAAGDPPHRVGLGRVMSLLSVPEGAADVEVDVYRVADGLRFGPSVLEANLIAAVTRVDGWVTLHQSVHPFSFQVEDTPQLGSFLSALGSRRSREPFGSGHASASAAWATQSAQ